MDSARGAALARRYTVTHITNVATLAMALADALGLDDRFVRDLGTAALLHDVGKLEVPVEILNCPTRLNDQQLALMRRHPEDGARILMAAPGVPDLAIIVAFEHPASEWWRLSDCPGFVAHSQSGDEAARSEAWPAALRTRDL